MSEKVLRGQLSQKPELIAFFKFCEQWTKPEYKGKGKNYLPTTADPENGREYKFGFIQAVMKQFGVKSQQTIIGRKDGHLVGRLADFPNGIFEESKHHAGVKSVVYEKWSQTNCYETIKQHAECWDAKKGEFTKKGKKYEAHLRKVFQLSKKDPLDLDLEGWYVFWGKPAKSIGTAHQAFTDGMTGRISYSAAISFRFAMRRSHASDIQQLIITEDSRFTTDNLKRPKGLHKEEFQSEEQIKALPNYIGDTETLVLDYSGVIFGGRFDALKELTPADIKREFHVIHFYEGKVNRDVDKPIYEPETSFLWKYIAHKRLAKSQKLFPKSIGEYNERLTAAGKTMGKTQPDLALKNDQDQEWTLTTHRGFKHTCVSQMALHGVRRDVISDYVGTDEATLKDFYQGGANENIQHEIGGLSLKAREPTWRAFLIAITPIFEKRFDFLAAREGAAA